MTAQINPNHQTTPTEAPSTGASQGNCLLQMSVGPAALAQKLIYEIMALYAEITGLTAQQKKLMTKAQSTEIVGEAKATIAGGEALKDSLIAAGVLTIGAAVGGLVVSGCVEKFGSPKAQLENDEATNNLEKMDKVQDVMKIDGSDSEGGNVRAGDLDDNVEARIQEFERGNYENAGDDQVTKDAVREMKERGLDRDHEFNYEDWKEGFDNELVRQSTRQNSASQKLVNRSNHSQMANSMVNNLVGSAGGQFAQGKGQAAKALHDANASVNRGASQMAAGSAGDAGQMMTKAYDAQNAEVQILERIQQTNSVNG